MPLKIVRNDITKMNTEAIVNTANRNPVFATGCDRAIYKAAGEKELLKYREEKIGVVEEGEVFITPGFALPAKYIIHAVSPYFLNGKSGEEEKLRSCYRKSLQLALENGIHSISFPLISTGAFQYPKEEGMRIAVDEINAFLLNHDMLVYLVVFGEKATNLGQKLYPDLESYIDRYYVEEKTEEEYSGYGSFLMEEDEDADEEAIEEAYEEAIEESIEDACEEAEEEAEPSVCGSSSMKGNVSDAKPIFRNRPGRPAGRTAMEQMEQTLPSMPYSGAAKAGKAAPKLMAAPKGKATQAIPDDFFDFDEAYGKKLKARLEHLSDTFSEYLLYLIEDRGMKNADVYNRAIVDRKIFSKIKNNPDYHPQKLTALCLCVGACLNLDETRDLLARAGYALSPCDKTDIIFSYFIEHEIYDMIELDIQLEEHGLPCIIS